MARDPFFHPPGMMHYFPCMRIKRCTHFWTAISFTRPYFIVYLWTLCVDLCYLYNFSFLLHLALPACGFFPCMRYERGHCGFEYFRFRRWTFWKEFLLFTDLKNGFSEVHCSSIKCAIFRSRCNMDSIKPIHNKIRACIRLGIRSVENDWYHKYN